MGPLDQGFWPDGIYTAPTDEALRYDIELTKKLGFNMTRKHVKVEPDRWYYWCDKLGLLVWQDMPAGDKGVAPGRVMCARGPPRPGGAPARRVVAGQAARLGRRPRDHSAGDRGGGRGRDRGPLLPPPSAVINRVCARGNR